MKIENSPASVAPAAPKIAVPADAIDAVSGSLAPKNSVAIASIEFYRAALEAAGKNPDELSFDEIVETTRRLYAISADFRRDRADVAKAEREAAKAKAKADRDAKRKERLAAERDRLAKKLAELDAS
jgi:hypothetical protein